MNLPSPEHEARAEESLATLRTRLGILVKDVHSVLDDIEEYAQQLVQEEEQRVRRDEQGG